MEKYDEVHKATVSTSCGEHVRRQSKTQAPSSGDRGGQGETRHKGAGQTQSSSHCHIEEANHGSLRGELETVSDPLSKTSSVNPGIKWNFLEGFTVPCEVPPWLNSSASSLIIFHTLHMDPHAAHTQSSLQLSSTFTALLPLLERNLPCF